MCPLDTYDAPAYIDIGRCGKSANETTLYPNV